MMCLVWLFMFLKSSRSVSDPCLKEPRMQSGRTVAHASLLCAKLGGEDCEWTFHSIYSVYFCIPLLCSFLKKTHHF